MKECYDHLGNKFESMDEMCKTYGINRTTFNSRIAKGWPLEKALTYRKIYKDHLGNEYNTIREMCKTYSIDESVFRNRIRAGYTIKEALKGELKHPKNEIRDHLGNKYNSIEEMCKAYGISINPYYTKIRSGASLEEILTGKKQPLCAQDINGDIISVKKLAKKYDISYEAFYSGISNGKTVEEILEKFNIRKQKCKDHLGNEFRSIAEMCKYHSVNYATYLKRIKNGASIKEALTGIILHEDRLIYTDYLNRRFKSVQDMCNANKISRSAYSDRIKYNWNKLDAIQIPVLTFRIRKSHIGLDGKQYYRIRTPNKVYYLNAEQIIEYTNKGIFERKRDVE